MDPVWTESGRRTLLAHEFVLAVQAELEAHRGAQKNSKALERAIAKVRERKPTYEKWPEPTLRRQVYVQPSKVVLNDVSVNGKSTPAQIRARTGLSKAQVTASLHWLWRRAKKLEHTDYGEYAPPGSATPHVFTKDAIPKALQSGSKTVAELEELTGKNRGELWAALRGLRDRGDVVEAYLIYPGRRGYRAAFALPPE
jgi:hypothetical protein